MTPLARKDSYLASERPRYSTDSLSIARTRITNSLRNRGYYFFRPEFIEYLADSIAYPGEIELKMMLASNTPSFALQPYTTGKVTVHVARNQGGGRADTVEMQRATLIQMMPSRLRRKLIDENVTFRPGRRFSVRSMDRTQANLARLGIFNNINIEAVPDTNDLAAHKLNVDVYATFDTPLETSLEVNASSKSNSYIGPGLTFGVTNKNIFGGGEQLSVKLTGTYEWQTGRGRRGNIFNSYEVGLTGSLAFPRLLAPKWIPRSRYNLNWTRFQLNVDLLNRPHYFKMAQFNASINYDWRLRRQCVEYSDAIQAHLYQPDAHHPRVRLDNGCKPGGCTELYESVYSPDDVLLRLRQGFWPQQYPSTGRFSVQEAGNVFWAIYRACGKKGEKELFGTPFSQFIKGQTQLVWGRRLGGDNWLVSRVAVGAAHAYGNSSQVPYAEQFYVGGANSIRAFTVRSIGPGSYRSAPGQPEDYFDRTGTFKFEANVEYRFPDIRPLARCAVHRFGQCVAAQGRPLATRWQTQWQDILQRPCLGHRCRPQARYKHACDSRRPRYRHPRPLRYRQTRLL